MIKNVIFDIGNVLMNFAWQDYMRSLHNNDTEKIKAIDDAIWGHNYWQGLDRGEFSGEEATEKAVAVAPHLEKEIRETLAKAGQAMHKFAYAIPWLKELKDMGKSVYYLSNYSEFAMAANPAVLDFMPYMDGGVFSCFVKLAKPDHAIYRAIAEKYRLNPQECLFTDDMPENVKAAEECGFTAVLFEGYDISYPKIMDLVRRA